MALGALAQRHRLAAGRGGGVGGGASGSSSVVVGVAPTLLPRPFSSSSSSSSTARLRTRRPRGIQGPSFESIDSEELATATMSADALPPPPPGLVAGPDEKDGFVMHEDLLQPNLLAAQYAVRGELYLRAQELKAQGKEIIYTNVGNPQALGAKPLTFVRQVVALCAAPFLLEHPDVGALFPEDAVARARSLVASFGAGGVGGYTDSRGSLHVREEVADFIARRDGGHRPDPETIFLTDGASAGVRAVLGALIRNERDAVMVPIPQYPLYSAGCALYGGRLLAYELDEANGWGLDLDALSRQVAVARLEGYSVRALVFINPGNPTGQCLPASQVAALVRWCAEQRVVLLADEVYQELVYDGAFTSAHKALMDGAAGDKRCELISFHSVSKGTSGECGLRGGYTQYTNVHPGALAQMYKLSSIGLCPNTIGQVVLSVLCNPPQPGDPSHELFERERAEEFASLKRRAALVSDAFNALPGMAVVPTTAAMYAFPSLALAPAALKEAARQGKKGDVFFCLRLLEETGICCIPGSGFGQRPGTWHLRTTFLPREDKMQDFVARFRAFMGRWAGQYGGGAGGGSKSNGNGAA